MKIQPTTTGICMLKPILRTTRLLALVLGMSAALVSVSAVQANQLRWAAQNDILTLDPHAQNHATTNNIVGHSYEPFVRYDRNYKVEPALATSWQVVNPTTVRFNLRKNVKFQDGSAFTADDVLFSFDRIRQPQGTMQIYVAGVQGITKIDDHTIDIVLDKPNPTLLNSFTTFYIMSKTWAEKNKSEKVQDYRAKEITFSSTNANGTGPYVIKEWVADQRVVMTANKNWWGAPVDVTDIVYTPIKSDPTRIAALLSGDVDLVTDLPTQDVARLRSTPSLFLLDGPEVRTIFIGLNQGPNELKYGSKGPNPFRDVRVRRAMNMAIDRTAIQRSIMRGLSVPAAIMVAPGVNGHTAELDKVAPPNLEGAKKLLADAGYANGFDFTLDCPNNRYVNDEEVCQAVVNMWARVGVRAKLNATNFSSFIGKIQNADTSAYLLGWGVATYDAQYSLQSLVMTRTTGADGNFNFLEISNAKVDALTEAMKTEMDKSKRDSMLAEALSITRDEALYIPLHHQMRPWAMKKNVSIAHNSNDAPKMYYATVKK
jgi:peptide/nickel transport system substrate-binding protein